MAAATRGKYGVAGLRVEFPATNEKAELAFHDVPPLVLVWVTVEPRALHRIRSPFKNGERPLRLLARDFHCDFGSQDKNVPAGGIREN
jgi:hypothetical protein